MEWRKSSAEMVALFESLAPGPPAQRKPMFGYPAAFMNGNLFASLFQENLIVRLGDVERARLLAIPGAATFEPMPGRPMSEYVVVPRSLHGDPKALRAWIGRALDYASSLPAKKAKKTAAKKPAGKTASGGTRRRSR